MRLSDALTRSPSSSRPTAARPYSVAQYERHVRRLAAWAAEQGLPDDVALLEQDHLAGFLASAEALRRPDGKAKRRR